MSGPVALSICMLTFSATLISDLLLSSTMQIRVTSDPIGRMGLTGLLVRFTEIGTGTGRKLLM